MADSGFTTASVVKDILNRMAPASKHAMLGSVLTDLITHANATVTDVASLVSARGSQMMSKAGLTIHGAASAVVKAATAFCALANGTIVRKAANTDMSALAGTLATAKSAAWAFYIDSAGTITTSAKTADVATHDLAIAAVAAPPAGKAMIGIVVIDNATGLNFVGGTTALDTGSLTVTYYDTIGDTFSVPTQTSVAVGALGSR